MSISKMTERVYKATKIDFEKFQVEVKNLQQKPTDEELLELYGLYKQATMGDIIKSRPWMWEVKECKKWDAWKNREGLSSLTSMKMYNKLVQRLQDKYNQ